MAYSDKYGNRPPEFASKSSHSHIIKDQEVNAYLENCSLPEYSNEIDEEDLSQRQFSLDDLEDSGTPIRYVIAVDGGYSRSVARKGFPSSEVVLFQFGALMLDFNDLEDLARQPFSSPKEMAKIKQAKRWSLVLPLSGIKYKGADSLLDSVRITLHEFFGRRLNSDAGSTLLATLKWLVYQEYAEVQNNIQINTCPNPACERKDIPLDFYGEKHQCPECGEELFLIDIFRFHEVIDEDRGAGGVVSYLLAVVEQMILVHYLRVMAENYPANMRQVLFLKDGPLAFFGETALMHKYMRTLMSFLQEKHGLSFAGLEKTGAFVDHAVEICNDANGKIQSGQFLLLSNSYICRHIVSSKPSNSRPYGSSTYYGAKLIFKDDNGSVHVVAIPVRDAKVALNPQVSDFTNLKSILTTISSLKCDLYDNSLLPVALINRAVSLANRPSAVILEKFAQHKIND